MNQKKRLQILLLLHHHCPYPKTELVFSSQFEFFLAVILSAKSNDLSVNKATKILFKVANTPEKILSLGIQQLMYYIKNVGLYKIKAKNIMNCSYLLIHKYNGRIPKERKKLESFPGIGRKTANVILNVLFHKNTIAVDTHVFRVSNRTHFAIGKNVKEVEKKLILVVPEHFKLYFHLWFFFHGKYVCTARQTKCRTCVINKLCEFQKKIF